MNEYITVARRRGTDWWIGSITNSSPRELSLSLNFLEKGKNYIAEIYADTLESCEDPNAIQIKKVPVTSNDMLELSLVSDGGAAIHISQTR